MELLLQQPTTTRHHQPIGESIPFLMTEPVSSGRPFIEANTVSASLQEIRRDHIIPVFVRENEPMISHAEFVEATQDVVSDVFRSETILQPNLRLSHAVKGRIPEAKHKSRTELLPHEETLYYERMAFVIEVPTVYTDVAGNRLNLTIGGVKAYNLDNPLSRSYEQTFKVFIGFQNKVCTNMCIATDGLISSLKVRSVDQLRMGISMLIQDYNVIKFGQQLQSLNQYELTEHQFATLIGRCRMYRNMPEHMRLSLPAMHFGDHQVNIVCRDYYADNSFCSNPDGSISLWRLYNLFTEANKSTYIDQFGDRAVNAFQLTRELQLALQNSSYSWFLN